MGHSAFLLLALSIDSHTFVLLLRSGFECRTFICNFVYCGIASQMLDMSACTA